MINVKELRIGNLVSDDEGVLAKIIGFAPFEHSIRCDEEEGCQLITDCFHANGKTVSGCCAFSDQSSPIPLTAEWLERCGFEYKDGASDYGHYRHNLVYIYQHDTDPGLFHFSRGHMEGAKVEIKYVHQLQNLYFALTGSELTINL